MGQNQSTFFLTKVEPMCSRPEACFLTRRCVWCAQHSHRMDWCSFWAARFGCLFKELQISMCTAGTALQRQPCTARTDGSQLRFFFPALQVRVRWALSERTNPSFVARESGVWVSMETQSCFFCVCSSRFLRHPHKAMVFSAWG